MRYFAILFLSVFLNASCGHHSGHHSGDAVASAYACPMDCEKGKTYPGAGQCPVCKMDLKPQASAAAQPADEWATLLKETEVIHDEAMKEMADMNRTGRQMKDIMMRAKMTKEGLAEYTSVLEAMDKAEAGMMTWMTQYKEPEGRTEESLRYLKEQKQMIEQNRNEIRAALEAGKKIVSQ